MKKFSRVKLEAESNLERAVKAEDELKSVSEKLYQAEGTIKELNTKYSLLEQEFDRVQDQLDKVWPYSFLALMSLYFLSLVLSNLGNSIVQGQGTEEWAGWRKLREFEQEGDNPRKSPGSEGESS